MSGKTADEQSRVLLLVTAWANWQEQCGARVRECVSLVAAAGKSRIFEVGKDESFQIVLYKTRMAVFTNKRFKKTTVQWFRN